MKTVKSMRFFDAVDEFQVAVLGRSVDNLNENVFLVDLKDDEATRLLLEKNGNADPGTVDRVAIARDLEPVGYEVNMANISSLFLLEGVDDGKGGLWQMLKEKLRPNS